MRCIVFAALVLVLVGCSATNAAPPTVTASRPGDETTLHVEPADRACAVQTMNALIEAMDSSDETRLRDLLRSASIGVGEPPATSPNEAVARLVARGHGGERWALASLDVNGRGGAGGVNFGVRMRRSGPGLPQPYKESEGKGAFDCPDGRVLIFSAT